MVDHFVGGRYHLEYRPLCRVVVGSSTSRCERWTDWTGRDEVDCAYLLALDQTLTGKRLIVQLITFHGGLAVTTIQLTALFLYQFAKTSSWCYFPVLSVSYHHISPPALRISGGKLTNGQLPKFYTITLILSLSLPHTHGTGPSPSHVFSLPTITSHHHPTSPLPPSPPASHRSLSLIPVSPLCNGEEKGAKRKSLKSVKSGHRPTLCDSVEKGWRKSQEWIGWSFVGRPTPREAGRRSLPSHKKSGSKEFDHTPGRAWSRQEDLMDPEVS